MSTEDAGDVIPHADRDAMYKAFEESPGDFAGYGAMADLLDELGYAALAHAFRWMYRRQKFPHKRTHYVGDLHQKKVPARFRWAWYGETNVRMGKEVPGVLPGSRFDRHSLPLLVIPASQRVYASHQVAVMELAKWLARLKSAYDLESGKVKL